MLFQGGSPLFAYEAEELGDFHSGRLGFDSDKLLKESRNPSGVAARKAARRMGPIHGRAPVPMHRAVPYGMEGFGLKDPREVLKEEKAKAAAAIKATGQKEINKKVDALLPGGDKQAQRDAAERGTPKYKAAVKKAKEDRAKEKAVVEAASEGTVPTPDALKTGPNWKLIVGGALGLLAVVGGAMFMMNKSPKLATA